MYYVLEFSCSSSPPNSVFYFLRKAPVFFSGDTHLTTMPLKRDGYIDYSTWRFQLISLFVSPCLILASSHRMTTSFYGFPEQMASSSSVASSSLYCNQSFLCPVSSSTTPPSVFCLLGICRNVSSTDLPLFSLPLYSPVLDFYLSILSLSLNGRWVLEERRNKSLWSVQS